VDEFKNTYSPRKATILAALLLICLPLLAQEIVLVGSPKEDHKGCRFTPYDVYDVERGKLGSVGCMQYTVLQVPAGRYSLGFSRRNKTGRWNFQHRVVFDLAAGEHVYLLEDFTMGGEIVFQSVAWRIQRIEEKQALDLMRRMKMKELTSRDPIF
jgi:hypothetical protein